MKERVQNSGSKAEAPEKLLNLCIEGAAKEVQSVVTQANRVIFDKIQLVERIEKLHKEIAMKEKLASFAEKEEDNGLALIALELKKQAEASIADYESQLNGKGQTLEVLYENLHILVEKDRKGKASAKQLSNTSTLVRD